MIRKGRKPMYFLCSTCRHFHFGFASLNLPMAVQLNAYLRCPCSSGIWWLLSLFWGEGGFLRQGFYLGHIKFRRSWRLVSHLLHNEYVKVQRNFFFWYILQLWSQFTITYTVCFTRSATGSRTHQIHHTPQAKTPWKVSDIVSPGTMEPPSCYPWWWQVPFW